jgi:hypothetical protein
MLVELRKLIITNNGYNREVSINKIFINTDHIVSIVDYDGAKSFLLSEGMVDYSEKDFSLIKVSNGNKVEEIIAIGTSEQVFNSMAQTAKDKKRILNG